MAVKISATMVNTLSAMEFFLIAMYTPRGMDMTDVRKISSTVQHAGNPAFRLHENRKSKRRKRKQNHLETRNPRGMDMTDVRKISSTASSSVVGNRSAISLTTLPPVL